MLLRTVALPGLPEAGLDSEHARKRSPLWDQLQSGCTHAGAAEPVYNRDTVPVK